MSPAGTTAVKKRLTISLRARERRLLLCAAVIFGCWAFLSWVVQPLWDRLRDLQLQVTTHLEKLESLSRLLTQAPAIMREHQELALYLETADTEQVRRSFLNELESLSRQSSVQLNLKPRPTKDTDRSTRFEVEVDVEGSQAQVMGFLDGLLAMPRLMTIERLRVSSLPSKPDLLRANLVVQRLILRQ